MHGTQVVEIVDEPVAVQVDKVATPAAGIDGIEELFNKARTVGIVAAVPRRRRTETHTRTHQVLPVVKNGIERLRLVVAAVARLVVGFQVTRPSGLAAGRRRRVVFIQVVSHALHIGIHVVTYIPAVAADYVEGIAGLAAGIAGQTFLAGCVPFEDAIACNLLVQDLRQRGHLQVGIVGNETPLVAITALACGKSDHIATLQFKGADAVVQLLVGERYHIAPIVL